MSTVVITGWRPGFMKVSCTMLVREHSRLGLADAKRVTDRVLLGREQLIGVHSHEAAQSLVAALELIGATSHVVVDV